MTRKVPALRIGSFGSDAEVSEMELPQLGASDLLLDMKVAYLGTRERSSVTSNRKSYLPQRSRSFPLTLGYQGFGVVKAAGKDATTKVGSKVFVNGFAECGKCTQCRTGNQHFCYDHQLFGLDVDGCLAQEFVVPERSTWPVPEGIPDVVIPGVSEIGTVWHGVKKVGNLVGKRVLVVGCGDIGLTAAVLVHLSGANHITIVDPSEQARGRARKLLPNATVLAPDELEVDSAFDIAVEAGNSPDGINTAIKRLGVGGSAILYSALGPVNISLDGYYIQVIQKEITLYGSHAKSNRDLEDGVVLCTQHEILRELFDLEVTSLDKAPKMLKEFADGSRRTPVAVTF